MSRMTRCLAVLGVTILTTAGAGSLADANASTSTALPGPVGTPAAAGSISGVVASADWGVSNGKAFYRVTKGDLVGNYSAAASTSAAMSTAATTACHEEISDVSLRANVFHWSTEQICTGNFGWQEMNTQLWRSSWSGPRGYGRWSQSDPTVDDYTAWNWGINCNVGHGYYDYYPVLRGYASNVGSGPTIRSGNQLNQRNCGTGP